MGRQEAARGASCCRREVVASAKLARTERQVLITKYRQAGRNFLAAEIPLLEAQRDEAKIDLYQPIADEVLGGLFGRVFRFLNTFLLDFHL
jgi:hypothetical protein